MRFCHSRTNTTVTQLGEYQAVNSFLLSPVILTIFHESKSQLVSAKKKSVRTALGCSHEKLLKMGLRSRKMLSHMSMSSNDQMVEQSQGLVFCFEYFYYSA